MGGLCCCVNNKMEPFDAALVRKQVWRPGHPTPVSASAKVDVQHLDDGDTGMIVSWDEALDQEVVNQAPARAAGSSHLPDYIPVPLYLEQNDVAEGVSPKVCEVAETRNWAVDANRWRFLLRTSQSLVAACLYGVATFLRMPGRPMALQVLLAAFLVPAFAFVYHELSLNQAGSYYNNFLQMFTLLPRLFACLARRDSDDFRQAVDRERRDGIVRTMNGLESGLLYFLMTSFTLFVSSMLCTSLMGDVRWKCFETAVFFMLHRLWGANAFEGRHSGFLQPESLWQFALDVDGVGCRIRPLATAPKIPY